MKNYTVKPMSNIAQVGLDELVGTECNVHEDLESPDGILVRSTKLSKEVINDNLKAISRAGAGVNNIPVEDCTEKGVVVFNTPGANANAVNIANSLVFIERLINVILFIIEVLLKKNSLRL